MKYLSYFLLLISLALLGFFVYKNYFDKSSVKAENNIRDGSTVLSSEEIRQEYKIVAFGDSLTAGYAVDLKDAYPSILEEVLNKEARDKNVSIKVVNMGVSGETSSGGLDRVDFVISQNPDLVLLGLGANDMLRATDPSLIKNNLEKIIKSFTDKNIPVILLGMESQVSNGINYKIDFDSIYPDLSKNYKLPLVPFFLEGVALVPHLNTSDGIHPNRSGYEKIIDDNIMNVLLPYLEKIRIL